ncbi:hypothetical protein IE81DRAFT_5649 [Ceraceosorus guamensis]|uniref:Telomerase reverse transcriptase n=1 Tax=Ceraceosorus guamensis TaxID=1522189 RepID=A0A316W8W3_9BASI|nr:hypothetical protein IE81DRAFT_5649 [Ceraceosorus guamensis]PWN46360.1 hypothetical protein IE81DRAFT_5649 [Ceraceosorus guamensis]
MVKRKRSGHGDRLAVASNQQSKDAESTTVLRPSKHKSADRGSTNDRSPLQSDLARASQAHRLLGRFFVRQHSIEDYLTGLLPSKAQSIVARLLREPSTSESCAKEHDLASKIICLTGAQEAAFTADQQRFSTWTSPDPAELSGVTVADVVKRAQILLLRRSAASSTFKGSRLASNLLTLGYRMADDRAPLSHRGGGLTNFQLNTNVTSITVDTQWSNLLRSLGANVFIHLLTNASIFAPIAHSDDCWMQLTGVPISDLEEQSVAHPNETPVAAMVPPRRRRKRSKRHDAEPSLLLVQRAPFQKTVSLPTGAFDRRPAPSERLRAFNGAALKRKFGGKSQTSQKRRKHTEITLVRSRIFYARPIRTRAGRIAVGLPINHVFNRTASVPDLLKALRRSPSKQGSSASPMPGDERADQRATQLGPLTLAESKKYKLMRVQHVMKHVWPLEYGLHNVFTSSRDWKKTSQPFQEYGNRDVEIAVRIHWLRF